MPIWIYAIAAVFLYGAGVATGYKVESWHWGASQTAAVTAEAEGVNKAEQRAIQDLKVEQAKGDTAVVADQAQQAVVTKTVIQWKERLVNAPPTPAACAAATARDVAVLDSVRAIVASVDSNQSGTGVATPGTDDRHSTPGPAPGNSNPGSAGRDNGQPGRVGGDPTVPSNPAPDLGQRLRKALGQ